MPKVQGAGAGQPQIHARTRARAGCRAAGRDQGGRRICRAGPACWSLSPRPTRRPARALRNAGATAQALEKAVSGHPQGPQGRQPERRSEFRRAEEIRARRDRRGAGGQARPGDRPRRGNPPHDPGARPPHQEQPGADRRARRRQDRDRRRPGAAHRQRRRAGGAEEQAAAGARSRRDGRRLEIPRRVRGAAEGRAEGDRVRRGRDHPVHRRDAHAGRRRARPMARWTRPT